MISWRRTALACSCFTIFAATLLLSVIPPRSEEAHITALNQQVLELFRSKNYREAQSVAEQTVAAAKARTGEEHPNHIKALIQLGQVLMADRRPSEAEAPLKRAFEIATTTLPADAPLLADALDALGSSQAPPFGTSDKTMLPLKQALAIREKNIKANEPAYLDLVDRLASFYAVNGQVEEADRFMARAIGLAKDGLGGKHPVVAALLWKLADLTKYRLPGNNPAAYARDAEQGYFGGGDDFKKMMEAMANPTGESLDSITDTLRRASKQFDEAEKYEGPSAAILDEAINSGELDSSTKLTTEAFVKALSSLAVKHRIQKRFAEAERVYMLIRDMRLQEVNARYAEGLGGNWASGMTGLLDVYEDADRPQDYEATAERLSAYYDSQNAKDPPSAQNFRLFSLNERLAKYYEKRHDFARAEGYWKKDIAECEARGDLYNLARVLAGSTFLIVENDTLEGFAGFYERHGRWAEAEAALKRAIDIRTQLHGPDSSDVKNSQKLLAEFHERRSGAPKKERRIAMPSFEKPSFLENLNKPSSPECTDPALLDKLDMSKPELPKGCSLEDIMKLGMMAFSRQTGEEVDFDLQAFRAQDAFGKGDWRTAFEALASAAQIEFADQQAGKLRQLFAWMDAEQRPVSLPLMLIKAAWRLGETETSRRAELVEATFSAAQKSQFLAAGAALGQMTARQASGSTALAKLVRERESLSTELNRLDQQMKQAVLQVGGRHETRAGVADRARMDEIPQKISAIDKALAQDFPDYLALAKPQPLAIAQAQAYLRPDEALVLMAATPRLGGWTAKPDPLLKLPEWMTRGDFPPESFVWVITKTDARWVKADLNDRNLAQEIFTLRCGLDTAYWDGDPNLRRRCETLLRVPRPIGELPPFHVYRAYALYRALFGQVEELIRGKQLLIAPTGPFTVLPYQVLVTAEPGTEIPIKAAATILAAHNGIAWLGIRQPITVLPSVASLKLLREHSKSAVAAKPFIGFGNPLLTGRPDIASHRQRAALVQEGLTCRHLAASGNRQRLALEALPSAKELFRDRLADVSELRRQLPLPETADELCTIAQKLGASEADVLLGGRMTEAEIKALSGKGELRNYRVLHFATHGLIASESETLANVGAEPALMFTPPESASETDDGLLTASEVTQLELDADWVIMSACRTAAGEAGDSEALSGLARAFFYAGARALLVSHWAVDSDAAVSITTGAFEALASNPAMGKAEALRHSLVALHKKGGVNLHPATWAPFSLVGGEAH